MLWDVSLAFLYLISTLALLQKSYNFSQNLLVYAVMQEFTNCMNTQYAFMIH